MTRRFRWLGSLGLMGAMAAIMLPACADDDSSFVVRGVLSASADTCSVTADPGAEMQGNGIIDVALADEYTAALLVMNQLVARGDANKLRTETSRVRLESADVRIENVSGAAVTRSDGSAAAFNVPIVGFVDPGSGTTPGYGAAHVMLIDPGTAAALKAGGGSVDLLVNVIIHGRTLGGSELSTPEFAFPIRACFGCLVQCPASAIDLTVSPQNCKNGSEEPDANCYIGRDNPVDCRLCQNNDACACGG